MTENLDISARLAELAAFAENENYIGPESALRLSARSSLLRTIKTIEKSLDRLQALKPTYKVWEEVQDYFGPSNPAQTFFASEIVRRNLRT